MGRVHARDQVPIIYDVFNMEFEKKYIPNVTRHKKGATFQQLVKEQLSLSEYEDKFAEPSRYMTHVKGIELEKARKFQEGIAPYNQNIMVPLMIKEYAYAGERALVIEDSSHRLVEHRQGQYRKRPGGPSGAGNFRPPAGAPMQKKQ